MKIKLIFFLMLFAFFGQSMKSIGQFRLVDRWPAIRFANPVDVQSPNDGSGRLFVVEQNGRIQVFSGLPGATTSSTFLNLTGTLATGGELGLLGLAFHPDYISNRFFYVYYTLNDPLRSVLARFTASYNDPNVALPDSRKVLLEFNQPFSNHNGGSMFFGNDGFLYISSGDGGSANDPQNNAQNLNNLLGKILRIDVNVPENQAYGIPGTNPFFSSSDPNIRKEIFAWGLRNPWKSTFDAPSGRIWSGDVGQNDREEVNIIENGRNYGWRIMEGDICTPAIANNCDQTGLTLPVFAYPHSEGRSITGGYVYRGKEIKPLIGAYFYGDFVFQKVWALKETSLLVFQNQEIIEAGVGISSFAVDRDGELYVVARSSTQGRLLQIRCGDAAPVISGNSTQICSGDSVILFGPAGASGYQWSTGDTTRNLVVKSGGEYFLQTVNAAGCLSDTSRNVVIQVFPTPPAPTISGPSSGCQGETLTLSGPDGFAFYGWNTGVNSSSIDVTSSGLFSLYLISELGCKSDTAFKNITISPIPATPQIQVSGDSLQIINYTSGGIQWFFNGNLQIGQSTSSLPFSGFGRYEALIEGAGTCFSDTGVLILAGPAIAPTISPGTGTYELPQSISLSSPTPGAIIYYTTTGNNPVIGAGFTRIYTGPFQANQTMTIRAMAVVPFSTSAISAANLTINNPSVVNTPDIRPRTGTFSTLQTVTITCATPGAVIYFTTNGNVPRLDIPNFFTRLYTGPFQVSSTTTIRALATKAGASNSPVSVAFLSFPTPAVVGPVVYSPAPGSFSGSLAIAMSTNPPDAQIWYTTNGNNPRLDIPNVFTRLYSTPVNISTSTFFRAVGVKAGLANGPITPASYTVIAGRMDTENQDLPVDFEELIKEAAEPRGLLVFPNPTSGRVHCVRPSEGEAKVVVQNAMGQQILELEGSSHDLELDISNFPSGFYLIRISDQEQNSTFRIIKQ
jgi:glucose/arabinose dehydrogenase